jgi:hypothetical protein
MDGRGEEKQVWFALLGVVVITAVVSAIVSPLDRYWDWDEAVYISQVAPWTHPTTWSAHRALGTAWLIAPVTFITDSVIATRLWMMFWVSAGAFLAFGAWIRTVGWAAVTALALFMASWLGMYYLGLVYPNLLGALAVVGCIGLLARLSALGTESIDGTFGIVLICCLVGASVALVTALRPVDGAALALSVWVTGFYLLRLRAWPTMVASAVGAAVGIAPWVIESIRVFGGVADRLREAQDIVSAAPTSRILDYVLVADGPLATTDTNGLNWGVAASLAVGLLFVVVGYVRSSARSAIRGVAFAGLIMAAPYLLWVGATAPRFLFPFAACWSICAAWGVHEVFKRTSFSRIAIVAVVLIMIGLQVPFAISFGDRDYVVRAESQEVGLALADVIESDADCAFSSQFGYPQVGIASGCDGSRLEIDALPDAPVFDPDSISSGPGTIALLTWSEPSQEDLMWLSEWERVDLQTSAGGVVSIWHTSAAE